MTIAITLLWGLIGVLALYSAHRAHAILREHAQAILALSQALMALVSATRPPVTQEDDEYH
jgi:hypothetical protein